MSYGYSNCIILKNRLDYNAEIMYDCLIECSIVINAKIKYCKDKKDINFYNEYDVIDGGIRFYDNNEVDNNHRIEILSNKEIIDYLDNSDFKFIDKNQELRFVTSIAFNNKYKIALFEFLFEYLKRNPKDYIWFECDWAYSYEDMKIIKNKGVTAEWDFTPVEKDLFII